MDWSEQGINDAISAIDKYQKDLMEKVEKLIDMMLEHGKEQAIIRLTQHVYTGETIESLYGYRKGNKGYLQVGGAAIWLEFGTGVVANDCPQGWYVHPLAGNLAMAGIGDYGNQHGADPNGWYYPDTDGTWKHTYGIPATMFFYESMKSIEQNFDTMAKGVWK